MDALEGWSEFNVALVGAAGALAGLLIVALSVNIATIVQSRQVLERAGAAIAALLLAVVVCAIGLIPGQPGWAYGAEVLIAAAVAGVFGARAAISVAQDRGAPNAVARVLKAALSMLPALLAAGGGMAVLLGAVPLGLGLVAASVLLSVVAGVVIAWVALVEVLR